jgi:acyl carrier protein
MQYGRFTEEEIRWEIKRMVAAITEREPEEVSDTASLAEHVELDSLMGMELMVSIDKKFRIDISEEDFVAATNVDQAVAIVKRYLLETVTTTASA